MVVHMGENEAPDGGGIFSKQTSGTDSAPHRSRAKKRHKRLFSIRFIIVRPSFCTDYLRYHPMRTRLFLEDGIENKRTFSAQFVQLIEYQTDRIGDIISV